jgi:hypothetical protein
LFSPGGGGGYFSFSHARKKTHGFVGNSVVIEDHMVFGADFSDIFDTATQSSEDMAESLVETSELQTRECFLSMC